MPSREQLDQWWLEARQYYDRGVSIDPLGPFPNEITYTQIPQQEAYIVDDINISPPQPLTATEVQWHRAILGRHVQESREQCEQRWRRDWEQFRSTWYNDNPSHPKPPKPKVIHLVSPIFCREVVK